MASTGEVWKLGHRPALDGLRGIAVLLVVAAHGGIPLAPSAGAVGVSVFFVLSGFLITALLLEEHQRVGGISLRGFYARRARRLLPALFASTAGVAVSSLWVGPWFFSGEKLLAVLTYCGNWYQIYTGSQGGLGGLGATWSLAVEEQFYVLWPLVLLLCLRRNLRLAIGVAVFGVVASAVWREVLLASVSDMHRVSYGSDIHAQALLLGSVVAMALHASKTHRPWSLVAATALLVPALVSATPRAVTYSVDPRIVPPAVAIAIFCLARGSASERSWLSWRPLRWFGSRSYGLYLWHGPITIYVVTMRPEWPWPVRLAVIAGLGVALAELSWRLLEQRFLRRGLRQGRAGDRGHLLRGLEGDSRQRYPEPVAVRSHGASGG